MKTKLLVVCFLMGLVLPRANAQYGVNWPTQPPTPLATDVEPGSQTLRVSGVNDFLYTYDINVVEVGTPVTPPNFAVGGLAGCQDSQINTLQTDAQASYAAYLKLFPDTATPSKSLQTTQGDWKTNVIKSPYNNLPQELSAAQQALAAITNAAQKSACQSTIESATQQYNIVKSADQALNNGPHVVQATFQVHNCKSEILTIIEKYKGVPTGQSLTVRLDAACDEFTVGGGVLLSEIQNRSYTSVSLPNQTGQFLGVNGTGRFHPALIVLTNFNLPLQPLGATWSKAAGDLRLGVSTGPAIQTGATNVSSVGWFIGGAVSFFHLLYISPGIHFGEFADFPPGFSSLQAIPTGFGALTPSTRWTGRFAIAITVKGWDLSKSLKGGTDQPAPSKPASK